MPSTGTQCLEDKATEWRSALTDVYLYQMKYNGEHTVSVLSFVDVWSLSLKAAKYAAVRPAAPPPITVTDASS